MTYWSGLNRLGRKIARNHYRSLRTYGVDRATARLITGAVVFGIAMQYDYGLHL